MIVVAAGSAEAAAEMSPRPASGNGEGRVGTVCATRGWRARFFGAARGELTVMAGRVLVSDGAAVWASAGVCSKASDATAADAERRRDKKRNTCPRMTDDVASPVVTGHAARRMIPAGNASIGEYDDTTETSYSSRVPDSGKLRARLMRRAGQ